jgi:hypothetical protein
MYPLSMVHFYLYLERSFQFLLSSTLPLTSNYYHQPRNGAFSMKMGGRCANPTCHSVENNVTDVTRPKPLL